MDGTESSSSPFLTWLGFGVSELRPGRITTQMVSVNHVIAITLQGDIDVTHVASRKERRWREHAGTVSLFPADHREHVVVVDHYGHHRGHIFLVPHRHLQDRLEEDGFRPPAELAPGMWHGDPALASALAHLAASRSTGDRNDALRGDHYVRVVLRRIASLQGCRLPDWQSDTSAFEAGDLIDLTEWIDARLFEPPGLAEMAKATGLSPSHCARKFRHSTGLSLHRFVNRRRILASMTLLQDHSQPIVDVAIRLGFSSQSHFARLFRDLTGMTPARYRKQFRPTIG